MPKHHFFFFRRLMSQLLPAFIGTCFCCYVQAQQLEFGKPFIQNFRPKDYKAEAQNWSVARDGRDIMYFANTGGVLQYDGSHWKTYKSRKNSLILALGADSAGNVYASGMKDFGMMQENKTGQISYTTFLPKIDKKYHNLDEIRRIIAYNGKVYYSAADYILEYADDTVKVIEMPSRINRIDTVLNKLVFTTEKGLCYLSNDGRIEHLPGTGELGGKKLSMAAVIGDKVVFGTYFGGMHIYDNDKLTAVDSPLNDLFKEKMIYSFAKINDSLVAVGTIRAGIVIMDKNLNLVQIISKEDGLVDNSVYYLYYDGRNGLWAATNNGISRVAYPSPFQYFDHSSGYMGTVESLLRHKNDLYINTHVGTYRLNRPDINNIIRSNERPRFERIDHSTINNWRLASYDGRLYAASQDGLYEISPDKARRINDDAATYVYPSVIFKDIIYVGLFRGLKVYKYNSGTLELVNFFKNIEPDVRSIQEHNGYLWLTSVVSGVNRMKFDTYDDTPEVELFGLEHGLPQLRDNLIEMVNGEPKFYTRNGIFTFNYETSRFEPDQTLQKLYADTSQFIYSMAEAPSGDLYMSSFNNTETVCAKKEGKGNYRLIKNPFQRLRGKQIYHTLCEEDKTWFTTPDNLFSYNASLPMQADTCRFKTALRHIILNEDSTLYFHSERKNPMMLPYGGASTIRFVNSAMFYHLPEQTVYQYKLEGYEEGWSSWTNENFRIYTHLPPGDYQFKVRAKNAYGVQSEAAVLPLNIATPWHQSWWAISIATLIGLGILVQTVRYFATRKLISRVEELEMQQRVQKERERISSDLHDHVGAQLTSIISGLKITENIPVFQQDEQVKRLIDSLKEDAEITITQLRDTIWTLHQNEITLGEFCEHVEKYVQHTLKYVKKPKFILEVKADESRKMDPNISLNLMRVIQEALQNTLKHAQASSFIIQLLEPDDNLTIIIKDDGTGFDTTKDLNGEHFGLENMKRRMCESGGKFVVASTPGNGISIHITF